MGEQEGAPGSSESASATSTEGESSKEDGGKEKDKGGMIGSIEEYANLVGTSVSKLNRQAAKKKAASGPVFEAMQVAPPKKKAKIEINQMSLGALKTMIDSEKEKIQKELKEEDEKTRMAEKEEEEARKKAEQEKEVSRKKAEQVLRRAKRKGDTNNPSKEEVDAAQELEQLTWQDRYMKNKKVKDVVEKSQLMSKVKNKLKEEQKKEKEQEGAPGASESASATSTEGESSKDDGGKE